MFERFTDRARRVLVLGQEEARMLNHNYMGTEHILLGLIHEGEGVAARALESLGIALEGVRAQVEEIIGMGEREPSGHIPFTPRAKKVLELSLREALTLQHNYIGTEHILLGLIREGEGVGSQILVRLGADLNRTRRQVITLLSGYGSVVPPQDPEIRPEPRQGVEPPVRWDIPTDSDLHAAILGLPLLGSAGVEIPLALLVDLVRLTGTGDPRDARLRSLTAHTGVHRLRALGWAPTSRVAFAGLLCAELDAGPEYALPAAPPEVLRDALQRAVVDLATAEPAELGEINRRITVVRQEKEDAIDRADFDQAAERRDVEKQLLGRKAQVEREWREAPARVSLADELAIESLDDRTLGTLRTAADTVNDQTVMMLRILGPAAAAATPALPLKLRDRITALPRITVAHRTLFADAVIATETRHQLTSPTKSASSGVSGVSRHGRFAGVLPSQLALPTDLFTLRLADQQLLYRLRETQPEAPPNAVTIVLDTTPATFGPAEMILRLLAHLLTTTLWAADRAPSLVTLDRPGLAQEITAPEDLVAIWTRRTLDPPMMEKALATAGHLDNPVVVLTQHHLARDLPLVARADMRVVTTHVAEDTPASTANPFHVHLSSDAKPADMIDAVDRLLRQELDPRDRISESRLRRA